MQMYVTKEKLEKMEALAESQDLDAEITRQGGWQMRTVYDSGGFDFSQQFKLLNREKCDERYVTVYWSHTSQEPYM
jgi:hypothetical protein